MLEGLSGGRDAVLNWMDWLREEGFVGDVERTWVGGGYKFPTPTEKGWVRLDEGRLFDG